MTKPVSPLNLVNEILFCQKNRAMDINKKCYKHIQHTIFQAGIWTAGTDATEAEPVIPSSVWMTIQRLASKLISKECGQANLIRSPFAEVEQQKIEYSETSE